MSERSRTRHDRASMSGEMLAFIAFLGAFVFVLVVPLFFPQVFNLIWEGSIRLAFNAFMWVWSPELILLLFILAGAVVAINILLGVKKLYLYLFSRSSTEETRDDWNDYRIK